jgi:lipid-A-disaccharide synthase-like uncharacterized protein
MHNADYFIYLIGLVAQLLFSARLLMQWFASEKAGKVSSPNSFWTTSIIASILLMIYGALRNDPVIIGGQMISYFIYLRNLKFKNLWQVIPFPIRWSAIIFPFAAIAWLLFSEQYNLNYFLEHNKIAGALIAWGGLGQVVFTFRFIYQWYWAERLQKSVIPNGFWLISLIGSLMIISYAILRLDPILFIGQIFGIFVYSRNLFIGLRENIKSPVTNY